MRERRGREVEREKKISYEELAHTIMEVEKSHHLLSASWKPRKAHDVVESASKGPRTRGANGSPWAEDETTCPSSNSKAEKRGKSILPPPFVLFRPSMDWMIPTHIGEGYLPY